MDNHITDDLAAARSFVVNYLEKYNVTSSPFHICSLDIAITETCFTEICDRKILILFLCNDKDDLSKVFCEAVRNVEIRTILEENYFLLAWDIKTEMYHDALHEVIRKYFTMDGVMNDLITEKRSIVLFIVPVENSICIASAMQGKIKEKDVLETLQHVKMNFKLECESEMELDSIKKETETKNDIGSKEFQQMMFDRLGDRDYDCFEPWEHEYLKIKIGFSIFGPPKEVEGYDKKQMQKIEEVYKNICQCNNEHAPWKDQIVISIIYACLEPLSNEKVARAKKYKDYNPKTDLTPVPLYILRKCMDCDDRPATKETCRIIIDHTLRVYKSWNEYLNDNKLSKCIMILPKYGRYSGDKDGNVLLETHLSPACSITSKVLKGADMASVAAGLASSGVFILAAIPAITIAPIFLGVAGGVGLGVGVYSLIRTAAGIRDRLLHKESMSFANSEARGAYINIVAASFGFVGVGATTVVSELASQGVNIGKGTRAAVNTVNMLSVGSNGLSVTNTTYEAIKNWVYEQQTPSMLTVVQLTSSILFFGHAVYNFKTAGCIIEETQANILQEYQNSLRSNRHRNTFNKLVKETIRQTGDNKTGQAEIIKVIRNISNKDEVFAVLTRSNKLFNKKGIKFSADKGAITLNGETVDILEFGGLSKNQQTQFLIDLPPAPLQSSAEISNNGVQLGLLIKTVFNVENLNNLVYFGQTLVLNANKFEELLALALAQFEAIIQRKIVTILKILCDNIEVDFITICKTCFTKSEPLLMMLKLVLNFLKIKMNDYEKDYQEKKRKAQQSPDFNEDDFNAEFFVHPEKAARSVQFFEKAVLFLFDETINEAVFTELVKYCRNVIAIRLIELGQEETNTQRRNELGLQQSVKVICKVCNGQHYSL